MRSPRVLPVILGAALGAACCAAPARAQINPIGLGVGAGATIPVGPYGDEANTGYSVEAILNLRIPLLPISFRGEAGYHRFGLKGEALGALVGDQPGGAEVTGRDRIWSATANGVVSLPLGVLVVRPYVIGGVGYYNVARSIEFTVNGREQTIEPGSQSAFGVNGGVGVSFPLLVVSGFAEARYHNVFLPGRDVSMVPLRVGVRF